MCLIRVRTPKKSTTRKDNPSAGINSLCCFILFIHHPRNTSSPVQFDQYFHLFLDKNSKVILCAINLYSTFARFNEYLDVVMHLSMKLRAVCNGKSLLKVWLLSCMFFCTVTLPAQQLCDTLFYHKQHYGSESQFTHLNVLENVGLSVVGPSFFWGYDVRDIPFSKGMQVLGESFAKPREIKQYYGSYGHFFFLEFAPLAGILSYPNYSLHFIGEGMLSRKLYELNRSKGRSRFWAHFWSISTVVVSQAVNEIIEAPVTTRGDAVADLCFNIAGIVGFNNDRFAKLFSNKSVQLYYWPGQTLLDVRDACMYNNSETYLLRTTLGKKRKAKFAFLCGIPSTGPGISFPYKQHDYISAFVVVQSPIIPKYPYTAPHPYYALPYADHHMQRDTASTKMEYQAAVRVSWDRAGSLMGYAEIGFPKPNININLYPGVFKIGKIQLGAFAHIDYRFPCAVGITMAWMPVMPGFRFNVK